MLCVRPANSRYSASRPPFSYLAAIFLTTLPGTTWSSVAPMKSSGALSPAWKSTLNGVLGATFASAPANSTFDAAGAA